VRSNSCWRRGTSFYSCNKHLAEIFCEEIAFRNKRLNYVLSVLKTQVRYQLVLVFDSVFGSLLGGGVVLSQFIQCLTCLCTVGSQLL